LQNTYPLGANDGVVVGSDAAGEVIGVGPKVGWFKPGDCVTAIHLQTWQSGPLEAKDIDTAIGGKLDGVLQEYGVLPESGLVKIPETLDFQQSSTLAIAALTAWNGLHGLPSKSLRAGQWVLTQGTGGVSIFALQVSFEAYSAALSILQQPGDNYLRRYGTNDEINSFPRQEEPKSLQPPLAKRKSNF
jgi:NADPH:quinone reductase-like Zn-dependent oxidoreductase